jgi:hypothetical protein
MLLRREGRVRDCIASLGVWPMLLVQRAGFSQARPAGRALPAQACDSSAGQRLEHLAPYCSDFDSGDENPFIAVAADRGCNRLRASYIRNSISLTLSRSHRIISTQPERREVAGRAAHPERSSLAGARDAMAFGASGGALPNTRF